jgi:hypothetical protein
MWCGVTGIGSLYDVKVGVWCGVKKLRLLGPLSLRS